MKKIIILYVWLLLMNEIKSMELLSDLPLPLKTYNQVGNEEITVKNIFKFNDLLSENLKSSLQKLIEEKQDLFYTKICLNDKIIISDKAFEQYNKNIKDFFSNKKISNRSQENIVFEHDSYYIKMAGPLPKVHCLVEKAGLANQKPPIEISKAETFLTGSMFGYYLRLKEAIGRLNLKYIILPKTYLMKLKSFDDVAHDENCFIVQEKIDGIRPLRDCPEHVCNTMFAELCSLIKETGGVNIYEKIYYHHEQNKLYILGIKDNARKSMADFFNPKEPLLIRDINVAICKVKELQEESNNFYSYLKFLAWSLFGKNSKRTS